MTWVGWALLSALFAAATAILAKVAVFDLEPSLATAGRTTVILLLTWGVALAVNPPEAILKVPGRAWLFLVLSGLATGLSWLCYFKALSLGPVAKVAPLDKLSVVFVLVLAALFLGEKLTWTTVLGGFLITAGAVVLVL